MKQLPATHESVFCIVLLHLCGILCWFVTHRVQAAGFSTPAHDLPARRKEYHDEHRAVDCASALGRRVPDGGVILAFQYERAKSQFKWPADVPRSLVIFNGWRDAPWWRPDMPYLSYTRVHSFRFVTVWEAADLRGSLLSAVRRQQRINPTTQGASL